MSIFTLYKKSLILLISVVFMSLSFSSVADPIYCKDKVNGVGIDNLFVASGCYVMKDDAFDNWNGWDVEAGEIGDYSFTASAPKHNDNQESLSSVVSFLTDFGFDIDGTDSNYYDDNGEYVGHFWELGKWDIEEGNSNYGSVTGDESQNGTFNLGEDVAAFMTIKSANGYLIYFFEGGLSAGDWSTESVGHEMSNITFWGADTGFGIFCFDCCEGDDCEPVPEPNILMLFAFSILVLVLIRRRYNKSNI